MINWMKPDASSNLLDVASGTGDLARIFSEETNNNSKIVCVEPNKDMLAMGKQKLKNYKNIKWKQASAESLPFDDNSFDFYTISYGIRNVTNINSALKEAQRVLKFFDQNPQIKENMRGAVIMDILDNVDGKIFNSTASASQLETVLDGYKQGTLKTVLGKDTYQALREMAEELKFLGDTTKEGSIAAGSIWAQLFKHPVATLTRLGQMRAMTKAISSRTTAKAYLAGQKAKLAAKRAGRELTEAESVPMLDALNRAMVEEGGVDAMKVGQGAGRAVKGALTVGGQAGRANVQTAPRAIRQQSRQTPTSVPVVTPPAVDFSSIPIPQGPTRRAPTRPLSPIEQLRQDAFRKANIRQRAKENPAIASTLLGGLGSAGLL